MTQPARKHTAPQQGSGPAAIDRPVREVDRWVAGISYYAPLIAAFVTAELGSYVLPLLVSDVIARYGLEEGTVGLIISGQVAAAVAIAAILAPVIHRVSRRRLAVIGALVLATCNLLAAIGSGVVLFVATRLVAGAGEGAAQSAATAEAAGARDPERTFANLWIAIVVMAILVYVAVPAAVGRGRSGAAFALMAAVSAAAAVVAGSLWGKPLPVPRREQAALSTRFMSPPGILICIALVLFAVSINSIWFAVERVGSRIGMSTGDTGGALAIAAVSALAGPIAANLIGVRFGRTWPLALAIVSGGASSLWLTTTTNPAAFTAAIALSSTMLMFGVPRLLAYAAHFDASGRLTTAVRAANSVGSMAAPAIGGTLLLLGGGYASVGAVSLTCAAVSAALVLAVGALERRRAQRPCKTNSNAELRT